MMLNNNELKNIPKIGAIDHIANEDKFIHIKYKSHITDTFYLVSECNFKTNEFYGYMHEYGYKRWGKFNLSEIRNKGIEAFRDFDFKQCKFKDIDVLHKFDPNNNLKIELNKRVNDIKTDGYFQTVYNITNELYTQYPNISYSNALELINNQYHELGLFAFMYHNFHTQIIEHNGYYDYFLNGYCGSLSQFQTLPIHKILVKLFDDAKIGDIHIYAELAGQLEYLNIEIDTRKRIDIPKINNGKLIYETIKNENYKKVINNEYIDSLNSSYKAISDDVIKAIELFFKEKIIQEGQDV